MKDMYIEQLEIDAYTKWTQTSTRPQRYSEPHKEAFEAGWNAAIQAAQASFLLTIEQLKIYKPVYIYTKGG